MNDADERMIADQEREFQKASGKSQQQALYSLVELIVSHSNQDPRAYTYCKRLFELTVEVQKHEAFGYDQIKIETYLNLISKFPPMVRLSLARDLLRVLSASGQAYDQYLLSSYISKYRYEAITPSSGKYWLIRKLTIFPSVSLSHLSITLAMFFLVSYFILLPTSVEWMQIIKLKDYHFTSFFDHFFVVMKVLLAIGDENSLDSSNWLGTLVLAAGKLFSFVFIGSYILEEIKRRLVKEK